MDDVIAQVKERISILDLVAASRLTVTGHGRTRSTKEHESLRLWQNAACKPLMALRSYLKRPLRSLRRL